MSGLVKICTGIKGFDDLFDGGILQESTVLVEGIPGAGKTTLGMEFIYRGIRDYGDPGIIITFEQFPASLYRDALSLGWDLQALEKENKLRVICTSPEVVLLPESKFLEQVVQETRAKRMLVDSVSHFRQVVHHPLKLRQYFYSFCNCLHRLGLTSFLVKELEQDMENIHSFEEFLVDMVVRLHYEAEDGLKRQRTVEVIKSRGQPHLSGRHGFQIREGGIKIFPFISFSQTSSGIAKGSVPTGIIGLDLLLGDGLPRGTTVLVAGEAGTGKSVLGLEYLTQGAKLYQENGLYVSLEEPPERIYMMAKAFSYDLEPLVREGKVRVTFRPFLDINLDELWFELTEVIKKYGIKRLVIDPLPALISRIENSYVLRERLYYLTANLNALGCTSFLLYSLDNNGNDRQFGIVQTMVQGSVILKYNWFQNRRQRQLEIHKMRGGGHITGNHLMEITENGIQVFPNPGGLRT
jgi:circadian clock protein KaiC